MYAMPTPVPISVHMFGLRLTSDCHQRSKNGQPAHQTTGAASTSSTHGCTPGSVHCQRMLNIASSVTITVSGSVHQKRRRKSTYSGFGPSSSEGISGSSAMPQIGQLPGAGCRTCGCIGQV
jgi:hypothetical protein